MVCLVGATAPEPAVPWRILRILLGVMQKLYYRIKFNQKNIYTTTLHSNVRPPGQRKRDMELVFFLLYSPPGIGILPRCPLIIPYPNNHSTTTCLVAIRPLDPHFPNSGCPSGATAITTTITRRADQRSRRGEEERHIRPTLVIMSRMNFPRLHHQHHQCGGITAWSLGMPV